MDFVIAPGALCLLMSMNRMAVPERLPGASTDIPRSVGREFVR